MCGSINGLRLSVTLNNSRTVHHNHHIQFATFKVNDNYYTDILNGHMINIKWIFNVAMVTI